MNNQMGLLDFHEASSTSREFWVQSLSNKGTGFVGYGGLAGWTSLIALLFILVFHSIKKLLLSYVSSKRPVDSPTVSGSVASPSLVGGKGTPQLRGLEIVSEADLKFLIEKLDDKNTADERWENVIDKKNNLLSYSAKCCKPKDGPLKYLSVTVFENCSPETLKDFYMDNDYRKQWDKTVVDHEQLQVDTTSGTEIGRTIKKFPLLTPREYVLAWRLWEGKDQTFYCFIKECEHPLAPRQRKYVRVGLFRSGWRIRKVAGTNACEIKMFHQEDAGLNVEMAKLAFAKGIWSYVCKMDNALRKYASFPQTGPAVTAVSLVQKVPSGLETTDQVIDSTAAPATRGLIASEGRDKKSQGRPSKKVIAKGLLLLGGVVCLSRGNSSLGSKVLMAYILTKLRKRDSSSRQSSER